MSVPPFAELFQPRLLAELAGDAEAAGWDGFFLWDHIQIWPTPICDTWVALTAIALATRHIKIGPVVTPLPRRRPTKVAREAVSLDHLSNGRLILGVGSGGGPWEYDYLGEEPSQKTRADMLDEALDLLTQLWSGEPLIFDGRFYHFRGDLGPGKPDKTPTPFLPTPVQQPRIPIWVAGTWPHRAPFRRAARWEGIAPIKADAGFAEPLSPEDTHAIATYCKDHRPAETPFDVLASGHTADATDAKLPHAHKDAGATWWLEDISPWPFGWDWQGRWPVEAMRDRIRGGPPS